MISILYTQARETSLSRSGDDPAINLIITIIITAIHGTVTLTFLYFLWKEYSETRQRWVNRLFGTTESALERVQGQESSLFEMGNSNRNLRLDDGSILGDDHAEYTLMEEEERPKQVFPQRPIKINFPGKSHKRRP